MAWWKTMFGISGENPSPRPGAPQAPAPHHPQSAFATPINMAQLRQDRLGPRLDAALTALEHTSLPDETLGWVRKQLLDSSGRDLSGFSVALSKIPADEQETVRALLLEGGWLTVDEANEMGLYNATDRSLTLGRQVDQTRSGQITYRGGWLRSNGETHILTAAPSGAGKGQCLIVPNLLDYPGSAVVVDLKGENYALTSAHRSGYGRIYRWSPFDEHTHSYNPLDFVDTWEDARTLTEAMIPPGTGNEKFWDDSARDLVTGLVMFVKGWDLDKRNMREVVGLLYSGKAEFTELLEMMREQGEKDRQMAEAANAIAGTPDNTRDGILTTARSHLQVWRDPAIERATSFSDWHAPDLKLTTYWHYKMLADAESGAYDAQTYGIEPSGHTVYLCLPQDKVRTYAAVLRVIIAQHVALMTGRIFADGVSKPPVPVVFFLDELPQLGYMKPIEDAISIVRSADIRLWLFVQDIDQLRATYPQWRSMAANCEAQIFFNIRENETARYVSDKLGTMRDLLRGETRPVADPAELMGPAFKDRMIIFQGNQRPAIADKVFVSTVSELSGRLGRAPSLRFKMEDVAGRQRQPPAG